MTSMPVSAAVSWLEFRSRVPSAIAFGSDHVLNDLLFFYQAEDGIRDLTVTGVQTCALPILRPAGSPRWLVAVRDQDAAVRARGPAKIGLRWSRERKVPPHGTSGCLRARIH